MLLLGQKCFDNASKSQKSITPIIGKYIGILIFDYDSELSNSFKELINE